jgi:iron complex transport system substrate-binding protein
MNPDTNQPGQLLVFRKPPRRVVSLVPSLTESLFDLGLGFAVVGITDYCTQPAEALAGLPRLGGPKNPHLEEILALQPDLVLANQEENTRQSVEFLEAAGLAVWVTFPQTVRQSLDVLWHLAGLFESRLAAARLESLETTLEWAVSAAANNNSLRCFCPIWYDPGADSRPWWMTFDRRTYCHDLLALLGAQNVFADRRRRYPLAADLGDAPPQEPGERDTRYPRVTLEEIRQAQPEIILLPDEPFIFSEDHAAELRTLLPELPAVQNNRIHRLDGSLITWHGTRLARALQTLPGLIQI